LGKEFIARDSDEESNFISDIANAIKNAANFLQECDDVETATRVLCDSCHGSWLRNSKKANLNSNPNRWRTDDCQVAKELYESAAS